MHSLQDHLIAAVAAAGILVATTGLQHDRAVITLQQTMYHAVRVQQDAFLEVLEQDLRSVGSGVPTGSPMLVEYTVDRFTFVGTADSTALARQITYQRVDLPPGSEGSPRYRIERSVGGAPDGASTVLSAFNLELLDADGAPTAPGALSSARRVRYRFEIPASDWEEETNTRDMVGRQTVWASEIAPSNLSRRRSTSASHPLLSVNVSLETTGG